MGPARANQRGIALILSFLVLTVLTVVVLQLVYTARVEMSLAANFRDGLENVHAARSAVELAKGVLLTDWKAFDSPESDWRRERSGVEVGEAAVSFAVTDEESRFNLRLVTDGDEATKAWARATLARILVLAREGSRDPDEPPPQKLLETILEWADRGDTGRDFKPGGGGLTEEALERRFLTLQELLFLEGFTEEILFGTRKTAREEEKTLKEKAAEKTDALEDLTDLGDVLDIAQGEEGEEEQIGPVPLADILTVWGDGRINLNTAHVILLRAMHPQMTEELARALDGKRLQIPEEPEGAAAPAPATPGEPSAVVKPGLRTTDEISQIEGFVDAGKSPPLDIRADLQAHIKVKSEVFRVRVVVKNAELTQRYEAILAPVRKEGAESQANPPASPQPPAQPPAPDAPPAPASAADQPVEKPRFRILRMTELD